MYFNRFCIHFEWPCARLWMFNALWPGQWWSMCFHSKRLFWQRHRYMFCLSLPTLTFLWSYMTSLFIIYTNDLQLFWCKNPVSFANYLFATIDSQQLNIHHDSRYWYRYQYFDGCTLKSAFLQSSYSGAHFGNYLLHDTAWRIRYIMAKFHTPLRDKAGWKMMPVSGV